MAEFLHGLHVTISTLAAGATVLLAVMFWNSATVNSHPFTIKFLKFLTLVLLMRAWEIASAAYRTARIAAECIPLDAKIAGLQGRAVELLSYVIMTWFLMRPETKKMLNGGR